MPGFGPVGSFPVASIPGGSGGSITLAWTTPPTDSNVGQAISWQLTASGGTAPYTYAVTVGSLPPGASLNASTGAITGTLTGPTAIYSFTITGTDSNSATGTISSTVAVFNPAQDNRINISARQKYVTQYRKWHKPWFPPHRGIHKFISINLVPARVTWTGFEVGYGEDGPARVTWLGLELARTIDPVIPYKPTLKASVLRAYVKRRPKIWQRQRAGHFVEIVQPPIPVISRLSTKILRAYKRRPKKYRRTIVGFTITFPPAHVSWIGAEAGYADESDGRVTWIGLETGYSPDGAARVTWNGLEVGYAPDTFARVTWNGVEAAYLPNGSARVSWIGLEVARPAVPNAQPRRVVFVTA